MDGEGPGFASVAAAMRHLFSYLLVVTVGIGVLAGEFASVSTVDPHCTGGTESDPHDSDLRVEVAPVEALLTLYSRGSEGQTTASRVVTTAEGTRGGASSVALAEPDDASAELRHGGTVCSSPLNRHAPLRI